MTERKNIDYSVSAVNLTNPPEIKTRLSNYRDSIQAYEKLKIEAESHIPEYLRARIKNSEADLATEFKALRETIDLLGSYQDLEGGNYAVKQRKVSVSYDAGRFEYVYPQFAPAIIVKTVDTAKLKGLIKGGLITEDALAAGDISRTTESYAYIIKTG